MRDEDKATIEASRAGVSSRADNLAMRLLQARCYIHYTLCLEYRSANEPSEPQLAFPRLQVKVAEKEEHLTTAEISTLQVLLGSERQGCTSSPSIERELVCL